MARRTGKNAGAAAQGRGRAWRQQPPVGDLSDPRGMAALTAAYAEWMQVRNYSPYTTYHRQKSLRYFLVWCEYRGITRPSEVTRPIVERYQRWLFHYRQANGKPLSFASQALRLGDVRAFFKWLSRQNLILSNPAADLDLPRRELRLPQVVLSSEEVERVLAQVDVSDPLGIRDRAILETFYSTGIRRFELARLSVYDVDRGRGVVLIRQGKGKKDRVVPIGERALWWVDRYLQQARAELLVDPGEKTLFLSKLGDPIESNWLGPLVRGYVEKAGLGKSGACHLFRHTMATLMLENGADIRFIQAILGHAKVTTTEIYTHVGIRKLKEIHNATHPARLREKASSAEAAGRGGLNDNDDGSTRAELLSTLEAEAAEEEGAEGDHG